MALGVSQKIEFNESISIEKKVIPIETVRIYPNVVETAFSSNI